MHGPAYRRSEPANSVNRGCTDGGRSLPIGAWIIPLAACGVALWGWLAARLLTLFNAG